MKKKIIKTHQQRQQSRPIKIVLDSMEYWKKRCQLAEAYIEEISCSTTTKPAGLKLYAAWMRFKSLIK